jgi:molybdopterin-containing oxidoreductase family iron-sulfur binding subunit
MGASLALAGLGAGCTRQPLETIVPYVTMPEEVVPGRPLFFATAALHGGFARGVLVESHLGRPTKVEGNPDHPASLGSTDAFGQASVLDLYDPDRSQTVTNRGEIRSWSAFLAAVKAALAVQRTLKGAGLRILTGTVTSPTLAAQIEELLGEFPESKWHRDEPVSRANAREGARLAFGEVVEPLYRLDRADVVLSLDADFLASGPGALRYIRDFSGRRKPSGQAGMNRLYVVESGPSLTGANADHRLPLRPSQIATFARAVASGLGLAVTGGDEFGPGSALAAWTGPLVADLLRHRGASLVVAGETQPPEVHALAHAMNDALGSTGQTVVHTAPPEAGTLDERGSLTELARDMEAGQVALLVILGANPVYDAPADLHFADLLDKVPLRIHLGLHRDETAERCHWSVPSTHPFEAWSDARAYDGTVTILQPLIAPLYGGKSPHEVLAAFTSRPDRSSHDIVKDYWRTRHAGPDFEAFWKRSVHDGVVADTASPEKPVRAKLPDWALTAPPVAAAAPGLEIAFRPDPTVHDGRYANNGWLQELPKPLTKLTWDNAALLSARTAARLGLANEDVVELRRESRSVEAPVWIVPGHADDCVSIHLGYGRTRAGRVGTGAGFNAYALRSSVAPWFGPGLEIVKTGQRRSLACTQDHWSMEGRDIIRTTSLEEYRKDPRPGGHDMPRAADSLFPARKYEGHAWGMSIDLASCVGCNACVVACQAENNIPVVGKDQVARGREMQWIRVDRYYEGRADNPSVHHQPVPCMQCEDAPCEVVCPVAATQHSDEGLNEQVYNRCVGTRYCSNNCPYKVRRFNFLLYQDWETPAQKLLRNPDVSVRSRGVMEKCTYCVQRINQGRIDARNGNRQIRDGEIRTACQQVCPAEAIVFGDINDPESRVSKLKAEPRNYALLAELGTRPRTTYLAGVRNPNPGMPRG